MTPFAYHHPHNEHGVTAKIASGGVPIFHSGFEIPVVTATNIASVQNIEKQLKQPGILHVVGRDVLRWTWKSKIFPVENKCRELIQRGYDCFIYADSNDTFFYRSIERKELDSVLGKSDMLFQDDRSNWPALTASPSARDAIVKISMDLHGSPGPSSGLWAARIEPFLEYCQIIRSLIRGGCTLFDYLDANAPQFGAFNDQGAWRLLAILFPSSIRIDVDRDYFIRT